MNRDFSTTVKDLDGAPILQNGEPVPVSEPIVNALLAKTHEMPGTEQLTRFDLAKRINKAGEVDITPEEAALMKDAAAKHLSMILVVGFIRDFLEAA